MEKQILNFTVNEQALVVDEPIKISTNKVNYIQASFDLGTNWSGYDSVRAVWFNDFNCISTVLDSLGNCVVPFEVMKRKGNVKVNLVGSISEDDVLTDRLTSYPVVAVIVDCTAQITGANTSPITPSEFEQFAQRVHTDADRAETAASNAETSAQNASDSATSAHNSAESAHDDKIAIEQAIAEVIQQIEDFEQVQVVVNTLPPSSQATSDFTDGVLTLGIPQGVKGDTGNGIQSIRKTGTSGLVDTYTITFTDGQTTTFTVTNGAKGDTGNGIASIEKTSTVGLVDTYTITYTDGTTSTFAVTNGEKGDKGDTGEVSLQELEDATVVQTLSDNTPYNYRRTNNGQGAGVREYDEIVGASVGWNQLRENRTFTSINADTRSYVQFRFRLQSSPYTSFYSKAISSPAIIETIVNATATGLAQFMHNGITRNQEYQNNMPVQSGHKYFMHLNFTGTDLSTVGGVVVEDMELTDLTLFNSQIADYVYSLEQSTAGSGVAWLKTHFPKLFDNGYQPFDSGSIKSVSGLQSHDMVGVNQWDEEWLNGRYRSGVFQAEASYFASKNPIPILPDTSYYIGSSVNTPLSLTFYDADMTWMQGRGQQITNNVFTTPNGAHYMVFNTETTAYGTTYNHDICINISDTSINGQYFPYEKHTYPLDSSVTLRGQYKLDANNQLYADGDVWKSVGQADRNYNEIDLGTLNWNKDTNHFYSDILSDAKAPSSNGVIANIVASHYVADTATRVSAETVNATIAVNANRRIFIYDTALSSKTASEFKTAMSGVKMVYELATPTTETATPYTSPQWCDSKGTEEYVGSELPVGHNTDYPMTMVDCADGLSNGTYTPKLTVTNGKLSFEWQSV